MNSVSKDQVWSVMLAAAGARYEVVIDSVEPPFANGRLVRSQKPVRMRLRALERGQRGARLVRHPDGSSAIRVEPSSVGQQYGRLTVLAVESVGRDTKWLCRCECGTEKLVYKSNVVHGRTRSCGCLNREMSTDRFTTHGMKHSPEYETWCNIKRRCADSGNADYHGRGIRVCDGWLNSFEAFVSDMGPRPSDTHSIDRKDNAAGYDCGHCPSCVSRGADANCRWATRTEQNNNTRKNVDVTVDGVTMTIAEASRRYGITATLLRQRLFRDGMTADEAVRKAHKRQYEPRGMVPALRACEVEAEDMASKQGKTYKQIAEHFSVKESSVREWLAKVRAARIDASFERAR